MLRKVLTTLGTITGLSACGITAARKGLFGNNVIELDSYHLDNTNTRGTYHNNIDILRYILG